jgi:peptide/nickel transport system permease protein
MSEKAIGVGPVQLARVTPIVRPRTIRVNPTLLTGLGLLSVVVLVAIAAPLLTPYDPIAQQFTDSFLPPFSP